MELHLGHMSLRELSEWYHCSYSTIRKAEKKKKYFKILELYAKFEVSPRGGVDIQEIYCDTYFNEEMPIKEWIKETIPQLSQGLAPRTFLGTGRAITSMIKDKVLDWKVAHGEKEVLTSTINDYVNMALNEMFGPRLDRQEYEQLSWIEKDKCVAEEGIRFKEYLIKLDETHFRLLTEEEHQMFLSIAEQVYKNEPLQLKLDRDAFLADMLEDSWYDTKSGKQIKTLFKQYHNPFNTIRIEFKARTGLSLISQGTVFEMRQKGVNVIIEE